LIRKESPIHAVVFSGDAAAKGKTKEKEVENVLSHFVSHIRRAAGDEIPFLICPGNHDVDLTVLPDMFAPIFADIDSPAKASKLVREASTSAAEPLWAHIAGFRKLASAIDQDAFSHHPLFYTKKLKSDAVTVGFACLNSAWMTKGGGRNDYGKLYLGEHVLNAARVELDEADIRIAVIHHPLDWLAPEEKAQIQRFLTLNFDAFLCGHKHDNNAETLNTNIGSLFTSNTGCVYQSSEYFNGYSVIDLDVPNKKWVVSAREYYFQRGEFDVATRFGKNGTWESPFSGAFQSTKVSIPSEVTKAINDRANLLLLSYNASDVAPKSIGALFVEPPLSSMSEKELIAKTKGDSVPKGAYQSLLTLGNKPEALFFIGKREAGKSLLLHHIAINIFQSFRTSARIGVVIDINAAKKITEAGLLEQAVEFCGGEIPRRDLVKLLEAGEVVVCIDNVKLHDQKIVDLVRSFAASYPLPRYVFAASEEVMDELSGNQIPDIGIPVTKMFVHSFRTKHTKELVKRWFGSGDLMLNKRILNVNQLLDRLRVPRTPFLVSVLSWVLEQRPNANVVNRASAIEVLIEGLLEKFKESKARKEFDSTIQQHFLAEFALKLNELDADWMARLAFDGFVVDYFQRRGLSVSTEGFAAELIRKGLLFASDERAGFKFDCFRAFFLAKKFAEIPQLWQAALIPSSVGRYVTELDLLTGLQRDRVEVLRLAKQLCRKSYVDLKIDLPIQEIDRIKSEDMPVDRNVLTVIESQISNGKLVHDDDEAPDILSADHEESRKRRHLPDLGEVGQFVESLRAFSMILRNSELIDDLELKRESFDLALELWANTAIAVILATIEKTKELKLKRKNGELIELADKEEEVTFLARAMIPQMMISVMSEALSTPKLELFVRERARDPRTLVRTLAVFLSIDNEDDQAMALARALLNDFRSNGFVMEMLFFRLLGTYISQGQEEANPKLRDLLGDLFVILRGGSWKENAFVKSRFLSNLDKNFLVGDHQK
jgi:hypothetical protein